MKFVIVGGGGYIGYHIGLDLVIKGHSVVLLDLREPDVEWVEDAEEIPAFVNQRSNLVFRTGNILSAQDLGNAFHGAQCVIHCGEIS
jgi:nucleoside-diphosphate-sugar epimerase